MGEAIKALIFDMDGVIAETVELHYLAWKRLADEEKLPFGREDNEPLRGLSRYDSLMLILKGQTLSAEKMQDLMDRKNRYFLELVDRMTPDDVLPGVLDLIADARAEGLQVALGSASQNAPLVLEKLEMLDKFDVLGDAHSIVNTKPAPDIFLWVAGRLNVHPRHALVVEDGDAGIQAAKAGGFRVLGVGEGNTSGADVSVKTLHGLTMAEIRRRFGVLEAEAEQR